MANLEANDYNVFDTTVEEILIRRDVDVIPALLERVNDLRKVDTGQRLNPCWYDSPVLMRDKVRFVLRRLLHTDDYSAMIGEGDALGVVNLRNAINYFERNRAGIASRLIDSQKLGE